MQHDAFIYGMPDPYVTWLTHMRHALHDWFAKKAIHCPHQQRLRLIYDSSIWCLTHSWLIDTLHDSITKRATDGQHQHQLCAWLIYVWQDAFMHDNTNLYVTWRIDDMSTRDMTYWWLIDMWHDSLMSQPYVTCLIHDSSTCDMTHLWLIEMWHVTWRIDDFLDESFITPQYVPWLIHRQATRCQYQQWICASLIHVWHSASIYAMTNPYVTWLIHVRYHWFMYDTTHPYVKWLIHAWGGYV